MSEVKEIVKKETTDMEKTRVLRTAIPFVDIYENDDKILLHADMPGVKKEDVSVNVDKGTLSLSGIRRMDCKGVSLWQEFVDVEYARSFSVPQSLNIQGVEAEFKEGVLKLRLPKSESARPKMIEIKSPDTRA